MKTLWLVLSSILVTSSMVAQQTRSVDATGNDFLEECGAIDKSFESLTGVEKMQNTSCWSYVVGVMQGAIVENARLSSEEKRVHRLGFDEKLTDPLPRSQIVRVVRKYIMDNPKDANLPTCVLVLDALKNAYPLKP